jgi:hypothetical protein
MPRAEFVGRGARAGPVVEDNPLHRVQAGTHGIKIGKAFEFAEDENLIVVVILSSDTEGIGLNGYYLQVFYRDERALPLVAFLHIMREASWLVDAVGGDGDGGSDGHIGVEDDGGDVGVHEELDFTLEVVYFALEFYILALLELGEADGFVGGILAADLEAGAGAALTEFLEPDAASVAVGATTEIEVSVPVALCNDDASYPHHLSMEDGGVVACGEVLRRLDLLDGFQGRLCAARKPKVRVMTTVRIWLTDDDEFTGSDFAGV